MGIVYRIKEQKSFLKAFNPNDKVTLEVDVCDDTNNIADDELPSSKMIFFKEQDHEFELKDGDLVFLREG